MSSLVGSVLLQKEDPNIREQLITITERSGNIFVNGVKLDPNYSVEATLRMIGNIKPEFYLNVSYLQATPQMKYLSNRNFLYCVWEDFAVSKVVIAATVRVSKMDYESGYDSFS
jgi:hypothetical protein